MNSLGAGMGWPFVFFRYLSFPELESRPSAYDRYYKQQKQINAIKFQKNKNPKKSTIKFQKNENWISLLHWLVGAINLSAVCCLLQSSCWRGSQVSVFTVEGQKRKEGEEDGSEQIQNPFWNDQAKGWDYLF